MGSFYPTIKTGNQPFLVPSVFVNGEQFYIKLPLENRDTLLAFGDTGGGLSMIPGPTIEEKNLGPKVKRGILKGIMTVRYILFSDLVLDDNFPQPYPVRSFVVRTPFERVAQPHLIVPPMDEELKFMIKSMPDMDVFLGQGFFMGKSWTIDYIQQKIWVNTPLTESDKSNPHVQHIGFMKNNAGENIFGHGSMFIEVNGEKIDVLFDTGASIILSDEGRKLMNTKRKVLGGSFIAASVFNKWHKEHPDWKYYPRADMKNDIIEVPLVNIGGHEVGPVLFASRPDKNWSEGMINSMDKIVKGAIGGSGLKFLKVTVDYNSELIKFEM